MIIKICEIKNDTLLLTPCAQECGLGLNHFSAQFLQREKLITHTAEGRGLVYFFTLKDKNLVLRHYKRGGLVAKISNDSFLFSSIALTRCYKELEVLQHLRNNKVNVPRPIAGKVSRRGLFYKADIITELVPNAIELHELLQCEALTAATWQAIGLQIQKMHKAQVFHGDINVKNIMLTKQSSPAIIHLLDFDKCDIKHGNGWKNANLLRFKRSLLKQKANHEGKQQAYHYCPSDWEELLKGYNK